MRLVRSASVRSQRPVLLCLLLMILSAACTGDGGGDAGAQPSQTGGVAATTAVDAEGPLTVYSGRTEELVGPVVADFIEETGIELEIRYGDTAELAATILEEGDNSPADVFFAQDAGALGALRAEGILTELPETVVDRVDERFAADDDSWVGISGRARTLAYNTDLVPSDAVPTSVGELTGGDFEGQVGWAPTNGSFQAFVTAMRVELGDQATREWVEGMVANDVQSYENNTAIVEAVGRGEISYGLVNHYYLYRFLAEDPEFPVENAFLTGGDAGALVNVAGVGILATADQPDAALRFINFLLADGAQEYFSSETYEYPLATGVEADEQLPALSEIETPGFDLSDLEDLQGTLELLRAAGALT